MSVLNFLLNPVRKAFSCKRSFNSELGLHTTKHHAQQTPCTGLFPAEVIANPFPRNRVRGRDAFAGEFRNTVNDPLNAHFQIKASYLINAPSTRLKLY